MNRFKIIIACWAVWLAGVVLVGNNPYMNAGLIFIGFMAAVVACTYVCEYGTEAEKRFMEKVVSFFS